MELLVPCAFALDLVFGDPRTFTHPVVIIGSLINRLETILVGLLKNRRLAGILLVALTLLITAAVAYGGLKLAAAVHPVLGWLAAVGLAYTTLALHSLHRESREVVRYVETGQLEEARRSLSLIVGRETSRLDEEGVLRACIETVAENTSDGVIGPLFYLYLGGPVLALLFKAASTLDSMVGYRDDRYRELGWAAARFDDLLNLIPARLTGVLMVGSAYLCGLNGANAWRVMLRDARKTSSPNAGYPESATAGALEVRLGGPASYFGVEVEKPTLGDNQQPITVETYRGMVRLMYVSCLLALGAGLVLSLIF